MMKAGKPHTFAKKIISKIYDPSYEWKYDIRPFRLLVLFFIVVNFHLFNEHPLLKLDVINITEGFFLIYILLFPVFFKDEPSFKSQIANLMFDFLFIAFFDYLSLSNFGYNSKVYALYFIPIIYCSLWFKRTFTLIFAALVSAACFFLNYHIPDSKIFYTFGERIGKLGPIIGVLILFTLGLILYKRYSIHVDQELEKRAEKSEQEKEYTRTLLKDKIDGFIAIDENGRITEANRVAWELLGYNEKEILKQNVMNIYTPGMASRIMRLLRQNPDGTIYNIKAWMVSKEGEKIPILVSASFLYDRESNLKTELENKEKLPSIGYFRDIRAENIFYTLSSEITTTTNEKELLDKIVKIVAKSIKSETCSVLTYDETTGLLKLMSSYGIPKKLLLGRKVESYDENEGMTGKVFYSGEPLNVSNIDVSNKQPKKIGIKWKYAENFAKHSQFNDLKHFLGTPLIIQGRVYGIIRVLNKYRDNIELDKRGFTERDQWLLGRISYQISILIEKIVNNERFEALTKVGLELNEMLNLKLEDLLETISRQVVTIMKIKACFLRMIDGENLKIKACYGVDRNEYIGKEEYTLKIGEGISGKVAKTSRVRIVEDVQKNRDFKLHNLPVKEKLKSMLSIPLKYRNRVIGVINCYTHRIHKFTEQETQIMKTFAVFAAVAIQNKKRTDELLALNEVARGLVRPLKLNELFNLILQQAKLISGADRLCIKKYDENTGDISTLRSLDCKWDIETKGYKRKLGEDFISKVIKGEEPINIPNYDINLDEIDEVPQKEFFEDTKSCIVAPIKIYGKVFGVLCLESKIENFFTEDDLLILRAFSMQAAIALRNAKFISKLKDVTEIFPKISDLHIDIDKVVKKIAENARKVLEADLLVLYRYDEKRKKIIWPPIYAGEMYHPECMIAEVKTFQAPLLLINEKRSHYAAESQKNLLMIPPIQKSEKKAPARFVIREKIASSAGILLKVGQEIVGIIFINYRTPHKFDQNERSIIENYASYIAMAIQNVLHFQAKEAATEKVLQAEKLASMGKAAGFFAHNARSDLGAVQIYLNQIMKDISKKGVTELNPILERMQKNLKNVNTSIVDLLDIAKKPELEKKPISFNDAFQEKFKDFDSEANIYQLQFTVELSKRLPVISLDKKKMAQVFTNLFKNSLEATSSGGEINMDVKVRNHKLIIGWENLGEQIPEDEREKIFDIFYSKKESWGFGLAYCKKIIEAHNGKIYVDPKFKKGTRFIIEIPY